MYENLLISKGDILKRVDGLPVESMTVQALQKALCGPEGTCASLVLMGHSRGQLYEVRLARHLRIPTTGARSKVRASAAKFTPKEEGIM
jgi:C-terminal processing protease CtpA/Prc